MTKRPHPEGSSADASPMQLKTRVGERQVNEGVNAEENMKKVYDKTLNMMMEGAREQAKHEKEEEKSQEAEKEKETDATEEESKDKVEPGQMYLSAKGEVQVAGVYVAVPEDEEKKDDKMEETGSGDAKTSETTKDTDEKMDEEKTKNGNGDHENGNDDHQNGDDKKDEDQPSLEKFGFKVEGCTHQSPLKAVRLSPATSPAKSPYKLEKRPLKLDEKMEEEK